MCALIPRTLGAQRPPTSVRRQRKPNTRCPTPPTPENTATNPASHPGVRQDRLHPPNIVAVAVDVVVVVVERAGGHGCARPMVHITHVEEPLASRLAAGAAPADHDVR